MRGGISRLRCGGNGRRLPRSLLTFAPIAQNGSRGFCLATASGIRRRDDDERAAIQIERGLKGKNDLWYV
jgi:hypothetical protein